MTYKFCVQPKMPFFHRDNDKMFTSTHYAPTKFKLSECLRSPPFHSQFVARYSLTVLLAIEMCYQQYNASNDPSDRVQAIL